MALTPRLDLRQSQSLVMTPQLQQAIRLLQMTNLDLRQYLENECSENPFLEVDSDDETNFSKTEADTLENNAESIDSKPSAEIDSALVDGTALTDDPAANVDYENRFETDLTDFKTPTSSSSHNDDYDFISSSVENNPISLQEHVYQQIDIKFSSTNERLVAHAFTESLQPSGWINTDITTVANSCGATEEFSKKILSELQEFEPSGLFARNLRECLLIQASDKGLLSNQFKALLDNLPLLAKGQFETLQRKLKCNKVRY